MNNKVILISIIITVLVVSGILLKTSNKTNKLGNNQSKKTIIENGEMMFDLKNPNSKIKLSNKLQEISALSYHKDNQLACLQDEKGDLFVTNYMTGDIEQKYSITGNGDFEGIEIIENVAYMLQSNGLLVKIVDFTEESRVITEHKTSLSAKNDCEGLCIDLKTKHLLIACKNVPDLIKSSKSYKKMRAVYEYDITKEKLNQTPKFLISLDEIKKKTGEKKFMPSGIAVHPINYNIYIISSVGNLMIVLNREGEIIDFAHLPAKVFRQPEGICFSPDGKKLFISNEGRNKKGNILIFEQNSY
ncbi:MAG: hypothetical protein DRI95_00230 [Bacteroidetes bacterium]|nr:MAG: hypothetical protein DRI95_00230 [Bacteroidota bacterium]